ncbi:hypothetical protein [Blastococcus deserti]|uniref:Uncharacterized protein n=1 Tax=Blastococcus deserti TaxID=2259033 RepID=A0ABW4X7P0_9ACTN
MTTYSVRLHAYLDHAQRREVIALISDLLPERYAPTDMGGSFRTGVFDIWLTVTADDPSAAGQLAEEALKATAAEAESRLSGQAPAAAGPPWLSIKEVQADEVVFAAGNIDLLQG